MKILYFTRDFSKSNQDFANQYGLSIRWLSAYSPTDEVESCDAVYGDIPSAYSSISRVEIVNGTINIIAPLSSSGSSSLKSVSIISIDSLSTTKTGGAGFISVPFYAGMTGKGGTFVLDSTATATVKDKLYKSADNYYYKRVPDEIVSVASYGVVGDGDTTTIAAWCDSKSSYYRGYASLADIKVDYPNARSLTDTIHTTIIQKCINDNPRVYFPAGTYVVNRLTLGTGSKLFGAGETSIIKRADVVAGGMIYANSGSANATIDDIEIANLKLVDTCDDATGFSEQVHLIRFSGVRNLKINDCKFVGFRGDGIYLGSGESATDSNHNYNVSINNCFFDGINKANRNGITVIDVDGITISGNTMINITASNMPGAIDFEPNQSADLIIKGVRVINNYFKNIGGNIAVIVFSLRFGKYTNAPKDIVISGNTVVDADGGFFFWSNTNLGYTDDIQLVLSNNTVDCGGRGFNLTGYLAGIEITNNSITYNGTCLLSYAKTDVVRNVDVSHNNFYSKSSIPAIYCAKSDGNVSFIANKFYKGGAYCIRVGIAGASITGMTVALNSAFGLSAGGYILKTDVPESISGADCIYISNSGGLCNVGFWQTDAPSEVVNTATTTMSFNAAKIPTNFAMGTSRAIVNGVTGLPSAAAIKGLLTTVRPTSNTSYHGLIVQEYQPEAATTKYQRTATAAGTAWGPWQAVTTTAAA